MVEPLKKEDIICVDKVCLERDPYTDESENFILVSRIKEIVKDIIAFSVTTNSRLELQCKIINSFKFLFDAQSPENLQTSVSEDRGKPSSVSDVCNDNVDVVGVSSPCKHTPSFNQNRLNGCAICGHEKRDKPLLKSFDGSDERTARVFNHKCRKKKLSKVCVYCGEEMELTSKGWIKKEVTE